MAEKITIKTRPMKRGKGKQRYDTISVVLSPEYGARIRAIALERGCSVSAVVEAALKEVIK
jgi:hypothetical protein